MTDERSRSVGAGGWGMIGVAALLLAVLHQDVWLWDDRRILFGFMPVGLAYHATYSLAAAALWACAVRFAWPSGIERWAEGDATGESAASGDGRDG